MELKKTKNLSTAIEISVPPLPDRNYPEDHRVYDILFPHREENIDINIENENSHKDQKQPRFGSVSTLDWLTTWRSLEMS